MHKSLVFILTVNISLKFLYFFTYRNLFYYFLLFFVFFDLFLMIYYLKYLSSLKFKDNKIFYKNFLFKYEFFFNDILSVEKRLLDKILILKLNNKKIKVYYFKENDLEDFYSELRKKRKDLFILKDNEVPARYYISYFYVLMLLFRLGISFVAYYIAFKSILIFMFVLIFTFKFFLRYFFVFWDLVLFYEFKKDFIFERKFFSSKKYYYKFFEEILIKDKNINTNAVFSFLYKKNRRIYIQDSKRIYSMQKAFEYVVKLYVI